MNTLTSRKYRKKNKTNQNVLLEAGLAQAVVSIWWAEFILTKGEYPTEFKIINLFNKKDWNLPTHNSSLGNSYWTNAYSSS